MNTSYFGLRGRDQKGRVIDGDRPKDNGSQIGTRESVVDWRIYAGICSTPLQWIASTLSGWNQARPTANDCPGNFLLPWHNLDGITY